MPSKQIQIDCTRKDSGSVPVRPCEKDLRDLTFMTATLFIDGEAKEGEGMLRKLKVCLTIYKWILSALLPAVACVSEPVSWHREEGPKQRVKPIQRVVNDCCS